MKRIQFTVGGKHDLLLPVRDALIRRGYALVSWDAVDPDFPVFMLWGADSPLLWARQPHLDADTTPVLLLSSSAVYNDRDVHLQFRGPELMDEAHGHVITSPLDPKATSALVNLLAENRYLSRKGRTIVVRPFNVYGPNINTGLVREYLTAIENAQPIKILSPGRQVRSFLYEDDFFDASELLVQRLIAKKRGIYNVGSSERVELLSLAKSLCHAKNVDECVELVVPTQRFSWHKVPSTARIEVEFKGKWAPISLRSGLFRMLS
ncbi:NAD-dependent epimerase/dehydratase family protein [bacterium]|nr:NAD-dependent epimerase/dehydratase family protein [bacterium]